MRGCRILSLALLCQFYIQFSLAQSTGAERYGHEWIDYGKEYVRIQVLKTGIQRVKVNDLPESFRKIAAGEFQLWHRGREVALLSATKDELLFYGEINDGSSDSLVFRPATARLNPYVSLYSEQGIYFLTRANAAKRASVLSGKELKGVAERFHIQKDVKTYNDQFAFETYSIGSSLNNSFYEAANSWTGRTIAGTKSATASVKDTLLTFEISLPGLVRENAPNPEMEVLVNGLHVGRHNVKVRLGANNVDYRVVTELSFAGWGGKKSRFELPFDNISSDQKSYVKINSETDVVNDWFSLSYYAVEYPQNLDMANKKSRMFTFPASTKAESRVYIKNIPRDAVILDISNPYALTRIEGVFSGQDAEFMVARTLKSPLKLLVLSPSEYIDIPAGNINGAALRPTYSYLQKEAVSKELIDPGKYDYLIITTTRLKDGAMAYAKYRESEEGGAYRTLVMNIRDIYDLFNYGEPSPVAIRAFMKYMLKGGIRSTKHNLFLVGGTSSRPGNLLKELVEEVPTLGDPGADILLVSGLAGSHEDVPAIPVGRLKAFNNNEIYAYIEKVKSYEHESLDISWRKKALHLSGGHSTSEIQLFSSLLGNLTPIVEESALGGKVTPFVKTITTVEKVDISPQVNEGVGLISFFGHGAQDITDMDFGYVSNVSRGYNNEKKYPFMYFNGCGVGNIFTSRSVHILSDDWIITPKKGAIAIFANSYKSYVSTSAKHIQAVYETMFQSEESLSIGMVLKRTCEKIVAANPSNYDIANLHQVCLQGDPALQLIRTPKPDYLIDEGGGILVYSLDPSKKIGDAASGKVAVVISNGGKYEKSAANVPVQVVLSYNNSEIKRLSFDSNPVRYQDTLWVNVDNIKDLSRVEVNIDPESKIDEFTKKNNLSDLQLNWDVIKDLTYYPSEPLRDLLAPRVKVTFDAKELSNRDRVSSKSKIEFVLEDDRILSDEVGLMSAYLKKCWDQDCEFQQLDLSEAVVQAISPREMVVRYTGEPLAPGQYEILLTGKDRSGNASVGGYRIAFEVVVAEERQQFSVTVSPNPATSYVRFRIEQFRESVTSVRWVIYDMLGRIVVEKEFQDDDKTEWYWNLGEAGTTSPGMYIYKITAQQQNGAITERSGKLSIVR